MARPRTPEIVRFTRHVEVSESGCWLWKSSTNHGGYGEFTVPAATSRGKKTVAAHRWAYEHFVGPIPDGLTIDHLCRVRHCVNPAHLEPVTVQDNLARRPPKTHCPNGHPYQGSNLRVNRQGAKECRTCRRDSHRRYLRRRRSADDVALTTMIEEWLGGRP